MTQQLKCSALLWEEAVSSMLWNKLSQQQHNINPFKRCPVCGSCLKVNFQVLLEAWGGWHGSAFCVSRSLLIGRGAKSWSLGAWLCSWFYKHSIVSGSGHLACRCRFEEVHCILPKMSQQGVTSTHKLAGHVHYVIIKFVVLTLLQNTLNCWSPQHRSRAGHLCRAGLFRTWTGLGDSGTFKRRWLLS